ncbi:MAG: hypothetical protein WCI03_12205 [bacterium]
MKMLKSLIFLTVLTALFGCEHHDAKTESTVSSVTDKEISVQSQSAESQITNAVDGKAVSPSLGHLEVIHTNEQSEIIWCSYGYGFDYFTLTNFPDAEEDTNSIPTNPLTNAGSTNSFLP